MKKMKRLSLFLALTLVLTTCFAGFENIYAGTVSNENGGKVTSVTAQDANSTEAVQDLCCQNDNRFRQCDRYPCHH